jgi:uncharacterized membrane protein
MARFRESIEVQALPSVCYRQWLRFEEFPRFMKHVRSITSKGANQWRWVVDGPLGNRLEWDAVIDGNEPDRLISWHSVGEPDVGIQGAVLFEEARPGVTRIVATAQFEPPAGVVGELVAAIFSNPSQMVQEDLQNFKTLIESNAFSSVRA